MMDQESREVFADLKTALNNFADVKTALNKYDEVNELMHLLVKEQSELQFLLIDIAHELGLSYVKINDLRKQAEAKRSLLKATREIKDQDDV